MLLDTHLGCTFERVQLFFDEGWMRCNSIGRGRMNRPGAGGIKIKTKAVEV